MAVIFIFLTIFLSFTASLWLGDFGIYLPLAVWAVFCAGNTFGVSRGVIAALMAATFSGLVYQRGVCGFLEPFTALIFFIPVPGVTLRVFSAVRSWLPGAGIGAAAGALLFAAGIIPGHIADPGRWLNALANVMFCAMVGIFLLPLMLWNFSRAARKLGLDIRRPGDPL